MEESPHARTRPARFNLARYCLQDNARTQPDKIALTIIGDRRVQRWTYRELDDKVRRLATGFQGLVCRRLPG